MTFLLSNQLTKSVQETSLKSSGYNLLLITPETQKEKHKKIRKIFAPDNPSIQVDLVFRAFLFRPAKDMIKKKRANY